jgi:hypothetical protein
MPTIVAPMTKRRIMPMAVTWFVIPPTRLSLSRVPVTLRVDVVKSPNTDKGYGDTGNQPEGQEWKAENEWSDPIDNGYHAYDPNEWNQG